ncbi:MULTISPECIES: IclR family transcriptional regulator [Arthrobacter]|uniref:Glycerol operon regulatory protein n=1 Tax=Arthrobacter terricola TaxID=2547396 RepID=A0A4R5KI46_9MICC|nr:MULTISPECIES: IclR family transcriptional regulator [Arthrobacter]MBT8162092.1 IclR family transcriptional regulator [Arthrobacter sp. GN70]TDF93910.1 IclR family transcriptional regulator [Arthrobacter terricola]
MTDRDSQSKNTISSNRSVARAISVLRALAASPKGTTATEVAKMVNLPRPTVFRLLLTLEEEGFVDRTDTLFSLGWDLARVASAVDPSAGLVARVRDTVHTLAEQLGETVTLSLRQGLFEYELVLQDAPRSIGVTMSDMRGMRWPHYASATGKLLLAELTPEQVRSVLGTDLPKLAANTITDLGQLQTEIERVRIQGWAMIDDELEDGIVAIAVPLRDNVGQLFAALAMVAPKHRIDGEETIQRNLGMLSDAAKTLTEQLTSTMPASA